MSAAIKTNPTVEILIEMLTENTGTHFLDSGGASGRHWQRNQIRDFDAEPEATLETWLPRREDETASWSLTVSTYHFLKARLEYDPERTKALHKFSLEGDMENEHWLTCMEEWVKKLAEDQSKEIASIYGEGEPFTVNTYNHDSLLSQVIQYHYWSERAWIDRLKRYDRLVYVALQIHGGADVRGGYTEPRVFRVDDTEIFDYGQANMTCENKDCDAGWYTDDAGAHWYPYVGEPDLKANVVAAKEGDEGPREGVTYVTEDAVYCPCCGKGKLNPWPHPA